MPFKAVTGDAGGGLAKDHAKELCLGLIFAEEIQDLSMLGAGTLVNDLSARPVSTNETAIGVEDEAWDWQALEYLNKGINSDPIHVEPRRSPHLIPAISGPPA